jgi:hypothetical protein
MNNIVYPDVEYWLDFLDPPDATYLILYAMCVKQIVDVNYINRLNKKGEFQLFEMPCDDEESVGDISDDDLLMGIQEIQVQVQGSFSGGCTPYIPATHWDPPEGGDPILDSVTVESIVYINFSGDKDDYIEIENEMLTDRDYTMKELVALAESIMIDTIDAEPTRSALVSVRRTFPDSIDVKIRKIIEDKKEHIKNSKAKKNYGL